MERLGTVAIVGVGLIGGSVGMTLRARKLAREVVGVGRDPERLAEAVRLGAIDSAETDLGRAVAGADAAIICTPVGRVAQDCRAAANLGGDRLLVTDAGSTKRGIVEAVESDPIARGRFVGAHPIAGSERSGVAAASADLFAGRACVLTPTAITPADRLGRARAFWESVGCRVVAMPPAEHDRALAVTSHLPHVAAAALASLLPEEWEALTGGAFRDGTRVAASDASLWADIFLANRTPILDALDRFEHRLQGFRESLGSLGKNDLIAWWNARELPDRTNERLRP